MRSSHPTIPASGRLLSCVWRSMLALVSVLSWLALPACSCGFISSTTTTTATSSNSARWQTLFNGKDLTGWQIHLWEDTPTWTIQKGVLHSTGGKGYLRTVNSYRDFELTLEARVYDSGTARGNSGVYIRSQPHANQGVEYPPAYEVQIDHGDGNNPTGSLYNRHKAAPTSVKDGEWFRMRILAVGPHIQVWVNDQPVLDAQDSTFAEGYIFLQQHHKTGVCEFRQIRLRSL